MVVYTRPTERVAKSADEYHEFAHLSPAEYVSESGSVRVDGERSARVAILGCSDLRPVWVLPVQNPREKFVLGCMLRVDRTRPTPDDLASRNFSLLYVVDNFDEMNYF